MRSFSPTLLICITWLDYRVWLLISSVYSLKFTTSENMLSNSHALISVSHSFLTFLIMFFNRLLPRWIRFWWAKCSPWLTYKQRFNSSWWLYQLHLGKHTVLEDILGNFCPLPGCIYHVIHLLKERIYFRKTIAWSTCWRIESTSRRYNNNV